MPAHGVVAVGDVGIGAVLHGGEGDGAVPACVGAAVRIGGGGIAGGTEVDVALRVQCAGLYQGIAARVGGDVTCARQRGDLVGLGLALAGVVDAARRIACLDRHAVGGEGLGVGGAGGVHSGQQFEITRSINVDAAGSLS